MEAIDILTGQNVVIKYESAGVIRRGVALLMDLILMVILGILLFYSYSQFNTWYSVPSSMENLASGLLVILLLSYPFLFESLMRGQTPGKKLLRIRVTKTDGSSPGLSAYFLRWILLPVDMFPGSIGIGMMLIIFSKHQQRLGDMAAGTVVVRNAKPIKLDLDEDFLEFSPTYKPRFPQAELLSEGQVRFISQMLFVTRKKRITPTSIQTISQKVKHILKITSDMDDRDLLETVTRDYNHYALVEVLEDAKKV